MAPATTGCILHRRSRFFEGLGVILALLVRVNEMRGSGHDRNEILDARLGSRWIAPGGLWDRVNAQPRNPEPC